MKSIFSMFAYWDRVHQFQDGHIKVEEIWLGEESIFMFVIVINN